MSKEKKRTKKKRTKEGDIGSGLKFENEIDQPENKPGEKYSKIKTGIYNKEIAKHHTELVKLQEWIKNRGLKVVVVFEGRDAAGKGGVIKKITQPLNPRVPGSGIGHCYRAGEKHNGIFNATLHSFRLQGKWSFLTEAGTTGPGWKELWDLYG